MKIEKILKKQGMSFISWQFVYYYLKNEKKMNVTIDEMKGNGFEGDLLDYLHSPEFANEISSMNHSEYLREQVLKCKEHILNLKKIPTEMIKYTHTSYYTLYYLRELLLSQIDITHHLSDAAKKQKVKPANYYLFLDYLLETKTDGRKNKKKGIYVNFSKLVIDCGLSKLNQGEVGKAFGILNQSTYCGILKNNNRVSKSIYQVIKNTVNEKYNINLDEYSDNKVPRLSVSYIEPTDISDEYETTDVECKLDTNDIELSKELLSYCEEDIETTNEACELFENEEQIKPITEQNIDVNKLIDQVDALLDIIKIIINK